MSADSGMPKPFTRRDGKDLLSEVLDFGPDPQPEASSATGSVEDRLKRLIEQLDEINARIDRLRENY